MSNSDNYDMLDVTEDELRKLGDICHIVTSRYVGKPKDIKIFSELKREMEERCHDIGFIVKVVPQTVNLPDGTSVWQPECTICGRVDPVEFDPQRIASARESIRDSGLIV